MVANFEELLGVQVESVEAPKLFPAGPYNAVLGKYETKESSQKGTPFVRFPVKLTGPSDGVDLDEFEEAVGMEKLMTRNPLRLDFYLTPDATFRLRNFIENSLEMDIHNRNFDSLLPECDGIEFTAIVKHVPGQREGEVFMNIDDTAAST